MTLIGDLERLFATIIWPNRLGILALTLGVVTIALIAAWRVGWLARAGRAVRRRPGRSALVAAIVLAVTLPVGWYLASPLVIRTELVEDLPVAAASPSLPSAGPVAPSAAADPTASPPPTDPPATGPRLVATGAFQDADDFHRGSGTASIVEVEPGRFVLRLEDFSVTNGPDLHVVLSADDSGYAQGSLDLGRLKATDGSFNYELPDGIDPGAWASVVIWCDPFAVQFAHAPLTAA
ncbi:MAG TPA: DM13 domain-containing protein [Candidatus Limnocylindrales bacterium]|nr:DM13 domain-containing protein [Candidatus Limnocylindrales bacterium]